VQEYVRNFLWRSTAPGQPPELYVQRQEPNGVTTVLSSASLFKSSDTRIVVADVVDFEVKGDFMFASKKGSEVSYLSTIMYSL
jgi:hypothetical protein